MLHALAFRVRDQLSFAALGAFDAQDQKRDPGAGNGDCAEAGCGGLDPQASGAAKEEEAGSAGTESTEPTSERATSSAQSTRAGKSNQPNETSPARDRLRPPGFVESRRSEGSSSGEAYGRRVAVTFRLSGSVYGERLAGTRPLPRWCLYIMVIGTSSSVSFQHEI